MKNFILATIVALLTTLSLPLAAIDEDASEQQAAEPTESQKQARDLLMQMAHFMAGLEAYSVRLQAGYDVLQENGQKIQFVEARDILLARPDRMRSVEYGAQGFGHGQSLLFDGETMTIWDAETGVFAQAPQPETVDHAILYFVRDLNMRLPLAPLLTTWMPRELERRLHSIDYVELTEAFGQPAHHLAARTVDLDFQVWVADNGEQPLPLRIVLTYREEGHPQYWAQFLNWNLQPDYGDDTFGFEPADGMRQIPFAIQVPPLEEAMQLQTVPAGDQP